MHCGFEFKINLEKQLEEGETTVVRSIIKNKKRIRKVKAIDIICPDCGKTFEYMVR